MIGYGAVFLSAVLIGLAWLHYRIDVYWPATHVEIGWFRVVGAAVWAFFFLAYVGSVWVLSRRGGGAYVEFDPPARLVETGPYRWTRNPAAACVVGMVLGEAVAFSSTGMFLLFCEACVVAHLQVVLVEEPLLHKRFGRAYLDYCSRVPRWIPRRPRRPTGR